MTILDERIKKAVRTIEREHAEAALGPSKHPPMMGLKAFLDRQVLTQEADGHMRGCARLGKCHCATEAAR